MKLVPYQLQLGHYVLERVALSDESMGGMADVRRMHESLKAFVTRAEALATGGKGRLPDEAQELQECVVYMAVLALFLMTTEEWRKARPALLRLMLLHAGVRKVGFLSCRGR
jgi:hypothetical protein